MSLARGAHTRLTHTLALSLSIFLRSAAPVPAPGPSSSTVAPPAAPAPAPAPPKPKVHSNPYLAHLDDDEVEDADGTVWDSQLKTKDKRKLHNRSFNFYEKGEVVERNEVRVCEELKTN